VTDPYFGPAYIDVDEWRDEPVRYRYVHGGFEGTDTRFSFYFPPAEQYEGRFLHALEGGNGGHENTALMSIGGGGIAFAFECGAYLVESNQGHIGDDMSILLRDPTVAAYRASAESARYGRTVAEEMYGTAPTHGYIYGGSGGSARCLVCFEQCPDVWNGAVPFIMGHSTSWSLGFSVQANAARLLGRQIEDVIDAMEPGGSKNPFAGLSSEQRDALAALYRSGLPRGSETSFGTSGYVGTFASHVTALRSFDPGYFDEFWSTPGYMGADGALDSALVDEKTTVARIVTGADLAAAASDGKVSLAVLFAARGATDAPIGIVVDGCEPQRVLGSRIRIVSGKAAGRELYVVGAHENVLLGGGDVKLRFEDVEPGDEIALDNREYLAFAYYYRHQVIADAPEYAQFVVDGNPMYPQRPDFGKSGLLSGASPTGRFDGKMIVMQNAMDAACWPNAALSYRRTVERHLGERIDDNYRLWFNDHAAHIPSSFMPPGDRPVIGTRLIDYGGCLEQTIRDLIDWVEHGVTPAASTGHVLTNDQALVLAPTAAARGGIQPVVDATANGGERAEVAVGATVTLRAEVEVPPNTGGIIAVEWDVDGSGEWAVSEPGLDGTQTMLTVTHQHRFDTAGTYFPAVRVTSHRDGDVAAPHRRVSNLGRCRVVVG
jgi:hypothetical protein